MRYLYWAEMARKEASSTSRSCLRRSPTPSACTLQPTSARIGGATGDMTVTAGAVRASTKGPWTTCRRDQRRTPRGEADVPRVPQRRGIPGGKRREALIPLRAGGEKIHAELFGRRRIAPGRARTCRSRASIHLPHTAATLCWTVRRTIARSAARRRKPTSRFSAGILSRAFDARKGTARA